MKIIKKIVKISSLIIFGICILNVIGCYNLINENRKLIRLKHQYENLSAEIDYYTEIRNNYALIIEEKSSLSDEKSNIERKISNLNSDINNLENKITKINKDISNIS